MRSTIFAFAIATPIALALATQLAAAGPIVRPIASSIGTHASLATPASNPVPRIPSWVRPGLGLVYVAYSAAVVDGHYENPIEQIVTSNVTSATKTDASGTTKVKTVGKPLVSNYTWTCTNLGACTGGDWQFWVDPKNATASVLGPEGEIFAIAGSAPYKDPWNRTWNATLLSYQNNSSGVRLSIAFDTASGLILYYVQSYPTEYFTEFYHYKL